MKIELSKNCRICGLEHTDYPWGTDGNSPSYEICDCCGVEFGNEDYTIASIYKYRKEWSKSGLNWFQKHSKPLNWNFIKQAMNIPDKYK